MECDGVVFGGKARIFRRNLLHLSSSALMMEGVCCLVTTVNISVSRRFGQKDYSLLAYVRKSNVIE